MLRRHDVDFEATAVMQPLKPRSCSMQIDLNVLKSHIELRTLLGTILTRAYSYGGEIEISHKVT